MSIHTCLPLSHMRAGASVCARTHKTILEYGLCCSMYLAQNTATAVTTVTQHTTKQQGSQPTKKESKKERKKEGKKENWKERMEEKEEREGVRKVGGLGGREGRWERGRAGGRNERTNE